MISKWIDNMALTFVIIGAVNWGLIGFSSFDIVAFLFGNMTWLSKIIYGAIGIAGLYIVSFYGRVESTAD